MTSEREKGHQWRGYELGRVCKPWTTIVASGERGTMISTACDLIFNNYHCLMNDNFQIIFANNTSSTLISRQLVTFSTFNVLRSTLPTWQLEN